MPCLGQTRKERKVQKIKIAMSHITATWNIRSQAGGVESTIKVHTEQSHWPQSLYANLGKPWLPKIKTKYLSSSCHTFLNTPPHIDAHSAELPPRQVRSGYPTLTPHVTEPLPLQVRLGYPFPMPSPLKTFSGLKIKTEQFLLPVGSCLFALVFYYDWYRISCSPGKPWTVYSLDLATQIMELH